MDTECKTALASSKAIDIWKNVDMYVGGLEHATGHLLYSRFWHKFLKDIGIANTEEPYRSIKNQGMILGSDNQKMSKRWGNVVNPDDCINTYGADAFRMYEMFLGPFDSQLPWQTDGIVGTRRFLDKVWRLANNIKEINNKNKKIKTDAKIISEINKTIKKVTDDIEGFAFNTAVSSLMILSNNLNENINQKDFLDFIKLLSQFAHHISDEIWYMFGNKKLLKDIVKLGIQVNGKLRGVLEIDDSWNNKKILEEAKKQIKNHIEGKIIKKEIYIAGKIISFVI